MQKTVDPLKGKYKSVTAVRAIRNYDPEFDAKEFPQMAEQIYIDAHEALAGKRRKKLHELVTENAYPNMIHQTENVSMYWEYIESLEAPTVKQVRIGEILTKDNKFAQVTVRFHTKQVCILYKHRTWINNYRVLLLVYLASYSIRLGRLIETFSKNLNLPDFHVLDINQVV